MDCDVSQGVEEESLSALPPHKAVGRIFVISGKDRTSELDGLTAGDHALQMWSGCSDKCLNAVRGTDFVFIDWILPHCSGLACCRRIRSNPLSADAHIAIVIEKGDDDENARRQVLKAGADDYLVGPVALADMLRRAEDCVPRSGNGGYLPAGALVAGAFVLDEASRCVTYGTQPLNLRPIEFSLLRHLLAVPRKVLSRKELIGALSKGEGAVKDRTVDVWMGRLRRSLQQASAGHHLRTVRKGGYLFDPN
jgi:two-component system phosphate regulon response regulator PhoB